MSLYISFSNFAKKEWESYKNSMDDPSLLLNSFPTSDSYVSYYCDNGGFSDWLASLGGTALTEEQVVCMVKTFVKHADYEAKDIPSVLEAIQRNNAIQLPEVFGLTTEDYWDKHLKVLH